MQKLKLSAALVLGIIIGSCCCRLFHNSNKMYQVPAAAADQQITLAKKQVLQMENRYQIKEEALNSHNNQLALQLRQTAAALAIVKKKNKLLQQQLSTLLYRRQLNKEEKDTVAYYSNCDSLAALTTQLVAVANEQDSISRNNILALTGQIQNRDSALEFKTRQYQSIKTILEGTLSHQQLLVKEVKHCRKKSKCRQVWGKIKTAGLLIFSGLAARQILR